MARNLILDMARFGEHQQGIPPSATAESLQAWFTENGQPFDVLVEKLRDPASPVPFVENLVPPNWSVSGGDWSIRDPETGEFLSSMSRPGLISSQTYHSQFNQAFKSLDQAIEEHSFQALQQAAATGIASIETFVSDRTRKWNALHPERQLVDAAPYKTFDDKVSDWLPIMTGRPYDKGTRHWCDLQTLRRLRDDEAIHTKTFAQSISFEDMANLCNLFRSGIAGTMFDMHVYFATRIPSPIIRAKYSPEVILLKEQTP